MSLLPYFYDFDEHCRLMEREFYRPEFLSPIWRHRHFDRFFKSWDPFLDFVTPMEKLNKQLSHLAVKDAGSIAEDDEKFQVSVDVQHFSPEEINVKVVDGQVIVEGNHEEKQDGHGFVSRRFVRKYALPKGCLPDTVQSKLSSDGVLTVHAPKVLPLPSIGERIIPITQTGPIQTQQVSSPEQQNTIAEGTEEDNN